MSPTRVGVDGSAQSAVVRWTRRQDHAWTATVDVGWLSITAGGSGAGGSISYAVVHAFLPPSSDLPIQRGHVRVRWNTPTAGQNVQVTQSVRDLPRVFLVRPARNVPTVTFSALGAAAA